MRQSGEAKLTIDELNARVLRLQAALDDRDASLFHIKQETQARYNYLRAALQALRVQYSGAVTLSQYEVFAAALRDARGRGAMLQQALARAESARNAAEDKAAALALQQLSLEAGYLERSIGLHGCGNTRRGLQYNWVFEYEGDSMTLLTSLTLHMLRSYWEP